VAALTEPHPLPRARAAAPAVVALWDAKLHWSKRSNLVAEHTVAAHKRIPGSRLEFFAAMADRGDGLPLVTTGLEPRIAVDVTEAGV
jgi:hypothetical protein